MSRRPPTCEDCYFKKNMLCALEVEEPCATFRPHRPERVVLPPPRTLSIATKPRRQSDHGAGGAQTADRCETAIAKACCLLPRDIRNDQQAEWVDEIQCARENGRPVLRRVLSLVVVGIPRLHVQRWLRSLTKGAIR